jgi:hypothetical protein
MNKWKIINLVLKIEIIFIIKKLIKNNIW